MYIFIVSLYFAERLTHVSDTETNGMPFLASMLYDPYMPMVHYWGHSAGFLPCICIDILNPMPVPAGKLLLFCQEHTGSSSRVRETRVLLLCVLCNFIQFEYVYDTNIQGFKVWIIELHPLCSSQD